MFASVKLTSIRETTLGANQWVEQSKKLVWRTETNHLVEGGSGIEVSPEKIFSQEPLDPSKILMNPMDIRTFVIELA
ncbi:hypothetical protein J437_LFUL007811 [Ladona fulva]|uniref:Uncharacterized protein n=1 Tax=Ladona fulva TaxID=123851 RepID=A0A8K0JU59_LADFU|nr:hypothetical protein J437_LFUL007811 [Ladona fulva]